MKRQIELKHVGPKEHVKTLIEELIDRLEGKLERFPTEAISIHVLFNENKARKLYRAAVTCHIPRYTMAAHEEGHNPGSTIRKAFSEISKQISRRTAAARREYQRRRVAHRKDIIEPE